MHLLIKFERTNWKPLSVKTYPNRKQMYYVFHDVETKRIQLETVVLNPFETPLIVSILSRKIDREYQEEGEVVTEKIIHSFVFREMTQVSKDALIHPAKVTIDSYRGVVSFPRFIPNPLWTGAVFKRDDQDGKIITCLVERMGKPMEVQSPDFKYIASLQGLKIPTLI